MTGELRAQRREPCRWGYEGGPCIWDDGKPSDCVGCNRDGTRWVTVGTLVADEDTDFSYVIEEASDGWRKARGVVPAGEPSEDVIRRIRDGAS